MYQYAGREIDPDNTHGLRDTAVVNVLRDENAVFDERAVRSFIGKPITDDHPSQPVTADNWRTHARGTIMGAMRDGEYLTFDLMLTDATTVAKVNGGKRELSNGYACDVEVGDFTAADGTKCQARQKPGSIIGNHVALVDRGRAGSDCAICDALPSNLFDTLKTEKPVKTMVIDGLTVDMANADTAIATVQTLIAARDAATKTVGEHAATIAARDTEIATLKTEKKALEDAKPTPAQLRDAAKAYAQVVGKAKAIGVEVTDAMDEAAIMKAAVTKVMGDAAEGWNDAQIAASFAVATKDAKVAEQKIQPLGSPAQVTDAHTEYLNDRAKQKANLSSAWKKPFHNTEAA